MERGISFSLGKLNYHNLLMILKAASSNDVAMAVIRSVILLLLAIFNLLERFTMTINVLGRKISREELEEMMERPAFKLLYEMLSASPAMQMLSDYLCHWLEDSDVEDSDVEV